MDFIEKRKYLLEYIRGFLNNADYIDESQSGNILTQVGSIIRFTTKNISVNLKNNAKINTFRNDTTRCEFLFEIWIREKGTNEGITFLIALAQTDPENYEEDLFKTLFSGKEFKKTKTNPKNLFRINLVSTDDLMNKDFPEIQKLFKTAFETKNIKGLVQEFENKFVSAIKNKNI